MTLTDHDIKEIGKLFAANNEVLADYFASKQDLADLKEKLTAQIKDSHSKIMNHISSFAKKISGNRRRIEKLEERVFKN